MNHTEPAKRLPTAIFLLSVALAPALHSPADAQSTLRLDRGTRVRVGLEEARRSIVATLVDVKPDTIVLGRASWPMEATMPLPVTKIRSLEVSGGRRSLTPVGAIAGMMLGAVLTGAYNGIRASQCFHNCAEGTPLLIGVAVGGVIGGVSFAFIRTERWFEIAVPAPASAPHRPQP